MSKRIVGRFAAVPAAIVLLVTLAACNTPSAQPNSSQTLTPEVGPTSAAIPIEPPPSVMSACTGSVMVDRISAFRNLQEGFAESDLIIEGVIKDKTTQMVPDDTATEAELAERKARGLPTERPIIYYEVTVDKVLKGVADSATITVFPNGSRDEYEVVPPGEDPSLLRVGDRNILFLREYFNPSIASSSQTTYLPVAPAGQLLIEKDNTVSAYIPKSCDPVIDAYRGKDKSILEKDIADLIAQLPKPGKENILQKQVPNADLIIVGTIQSVGEAHFVNSMEKSPQEIDQLLAEGKMPGLVLTDYVVVVDKVLSDKLIHYPRFFPDRKPLEPGQTILVMRQGGTYKGVTKIEEPGPAFVIGSQEVLFLVSASLKNYDLPDDGQARYSTDSRAGRLLIGADGKLTAFTSRDVGGLYGGQTVGQLEQDIAEFLKQHPFK